MHITFLKVNNHYETFRGFLLPCILRVISLGDLNCHKGNEEQVSEKHKRTRLRETVGDGSYKLKHRTVIKSRCSAKDFLRGVLNGLLAEM